MALLAFPLFATVIILPDDGILYVRSLVAVVVSVAYTYSLVKSYQAYHRERDWEALRQFIMSFELFFGVALITTGYINVAFFSGNPAWTDFLRNLGYILLGVLAVGGFTLAFSWRKPPEAEIRRRRRTDLPG